MVEGSVSNLEEVTASSSKEKAAGDEIANLTKAFELFSQETARLEKAYHTLQKRFESVNLELEESNTQLNGKVVELNNVTGYLDNLLSHISQGIIFVGRNGTVRTFNPAAEEILGISADKVLLKRFSESFDDEMFGFSMKGVLDSERAPEVIFTLISLPGGGDRDLEVSTNFIQKGPKAHRGLLVLLRDVTEIRRLERLASRNDRMKELGEMAASVAHEIRNPLGGIEGFASLLYRDLEDMPESREFAAHIVEGAKTLNSLITKVLHYARPMQMHCELVEMVAFIREVVAFLKVDKAFAGKISFSLEVKSEKIPLSIDPSMFRAALFNLLVNAAQAMPEGGNVVIRLTREEEFVYLRIIDSGMGIAEKDIEKIFSPFFTTKHEGNGFGLSEVYKVIQAHAGTIDVDSKVGSGTSFTIKLPVILKHSEGVVDGH